MAQNEKTKVLILVQGSYDLKSEATAEGRMLANLLGHFNTQNNIRGVDHYTEGELDPYNVVFYIGYRANVRIPDVLATDLLRTDKTIVWINRGLDYLCSHYAADKKLGFSVSGFEDSSRYNKVIAGTKVFTKGTSLIHYIKINDPKKAFVLAEAKGDMVPATPYLVRSGKFWYFADSPFKRAGHTDRYLLFADLLHDILEEPHAEKHQALIRIEDVSPYSDPDDVRNIADVMKKNNVPFVISVIPFYKNPAENISYSLSDRPDMVDALKYAVARGASLAMHGSTHQYRGQTADDFEFWDAIADRPITGETEGNISGKIESGIHEFMKNGLYPITWETPHYTASVLSYNVIARYFHTAVEQPMVINNRNYGQMMPYILNNDVYGRMVFPENQGFLALLSSLDSEKIYLNKVLNQATYMRYVRDGVASFYFHSFLNTALLQDLIDGIKRMNYQFLDIKAYTHKVQGRDRVILCGSQSYEIKIHDAFLSEAYFDPKGMIIKRIISSAKQNGVHKQYVELMPGCVYKAEPMEHKTKELSWSEQMTHQIEQVSRSLFSSGDKWNEARVGVLWLPTARGAASHDQSSFIAALKSVCMFVDTLDINQSNNYSRYNLIVVPFVSSDSINPLQIDRLATYVRNGGNLITDRKNSMIEKLGFTFSSTGINISNIRDKYYVNENIQWTYPDIMFKFDYSNQDKIFCEDIDSRTAVVVGRKVGKGKVLYFNTPFDPNSDLGYSRYPFFIDYIKTWFNLLPVVKRENLEFYFDPGYRQNISVETSVSQWVSSGIRIVHVAGWHEYPKFTYDYERLIRLAHANGILVFAWLEPPQVSQKFWLEHPKWREKNFMNEDVRPSWRYPVAMTDENCMNAVIGEYSKFLKSYDWDGVNLAELYFESDNGFHNGNMFTPMHSSAVREMWLKYNFNIRDLFVPSSGYYWYYNYEYMQDFIRYRIEKITMLHKKFIDCFEKIAETRPGFQIMVTTLDSYGSPELKETIGISTDQIIALQKECGFFLQVEDPASRWSESPVRYKSIGDLYAGKMDRNKLLLDLNILNVRTPEEVSPFPTLIQTGTECFHLIHSSALGAPRFTVYGEASVNPQDMPYLSYASAGMVKCLPDEIGYTVSSPYSFVLKLPGRQKVISVDGKPVMGLRDNIFIIPAGDHQIETRNQDRSGFSTVELQPQILSFTGNILHVTYEMQKVRFSYESDGRALLCLNNKISKLTLDGKPSEFNMMKGVDCFTIFLPEGKHLVEINTGNNISFGINITSLWSTTAIVIFGTIAVSLILLMYLALKIIRRRAERD